LADGADGAPLDPVFSEDPFFTGEFDIIELTGGIIPMDDPHGAPTRPADVVPPGLPPSLSSDPELLAVDGGERTTVEVPGLGGTPGAVTLRHSEVRARVQTEARRSLARWRARSREEEEEEEEEETGESTREVVVPALPAHAPMRLSTDTPREVTRVDRVRFEELGLADAAPEPTTADVASLGEVALTDIDRALADLDEEIGDLDLVEEDPYEASGLFIVDRKQTTNRDALPNMTARLKLRLPGLEEDLALPAPWGQYIFELRGEILARKNPRLRAAYLHEASDVLRLTGDRWRPLAYDLDMRALDLHPMYLPALRSRLVECWRSGDAQAYAAALDEAFTQASRLDMEGEPDAQMVLGALRFELGVIKEVQGDLVGAHGLYIEATRLSHSDPFFYLNLARVFLADGEVGSYAEMMSACSALAGEQAEADSIRALLLCDTAEAVRRSGRLEDAHGLYESALTYDPTLMMAYRGLQLLGWSQSDVMLEIEGLKGQLALLIERGSRLTRGDSQRKLLKRKVAGRFYRLARLLWGLGHAEEASSALQDALGVRRGELIFLRSQERMARRMGQFGLVADAINRQNGMLGDPALRALLFVEQARAMAQAGDDDGARTFLKQSLELVPDCLPAQLEFQRLMLRSDDPEALLMLFAEHRSETPDPSAAWAAERAIAAMRRGEVHEFLRGDLEAAVEAYRHAMAWSPGAGPWMRALERVLLLQQRYADLATLYGEVIARTRHPALRRAMLLKLARLGVVHEQYELAISTYLQLLESQEPELDHLEELAHLYRLYGWPQEAAQILEQVVELGQQLAQDLGPTSAEGRSAVQASVRSLKWLTVLHADNNTPDAALAAHSRLLELRPGDAEALERRKRLLIQHGDWLQLVDLLVQQADATEIDITRRELWMEAAELCVVRIRDRHRALKILSDLCQHFPDYAAGADALEQLLRSRDDHAALADLLLARAAQVADTDPTEAVRQSFEAAMLRRERLEDDEGALDALRVVLDIDPRFVPALRAVGEVLHRLAMFEELADHLDAWMAHPVSDDTWLGLAHGLGYLKEFPLDLPLEAVAVYHEILDRAPADVVAMTALIRLFARLRQRVDEAAMLELLADHVSDRDDKIGMFKRAARLRERLGLDPTRQWERALELDAGDIEAEHGLERSLRRAGAWARLLTFYLQQAKTGDNDRRLYHLVKIAGVYTTIGRDSDALEILRKVLALDGEQHTARLMLVETARRLQLWELVASTEVELADSTSDDTLRLGHLAEAARLYQDVLNQPNEARALLREVLTIDPTYDGAYQGLRAYYDGAEDVDHHAELLDVLDAKLAVAPPAERAAMLHEAAVLARDSGDLVRAARYLEDLLRDDPDDLVALELAAELSHLAGRVDDLVLFLRRRLEVVRPDEDDPELRASFLDQLSQAEIDDLGDPESAAIHLSELMALAPDHDAGRERLARVYLHLGQFEQACTLYKDLFETHPDPRTALVIAELLEVHIRRRQEALAWYLRAQDLDPLDGAALRGFARLSEQLERRSGVAMNLRVLSDRLDAIKDAHREGVRRDPWRIELYAQLARIHHLRGDIDQLSILLNLLDYFGYDDNLDDIRRPILHRGGQLLLRGQGGRLGLDELRAFVLPDDAQGMRRRIFAMLWETVAAVDPDDLRARGVSRNDRLTERDGDPRFGKISHLARALNVFGVDVYQHPKDAYAVLPLFTPEPTLVVGHAIFEKDTDPFHHFRVARALESLRDGKGLLERKDALEALGALDEMMLALYSDEVSSLPVFCETPPPRAWLADASRRLQRALSRRTRKDLKAILDVGDEDPPSTALGWIDGCRMAPVRTGLAVCGAFSVAADAVAGTSFSLDRERGHARMEAVLTALKRPDVAPVVEGMLRFVTSDEFAGLRSCLQLQNEPVE